MKTKKEPQREGGEGGEREGEKRHREKPREESIMDRD